MEQINSTIFGSTPVLDESDPEYEALKVLIEKFPVDAFGFVNKKLNELGFRLLVDRDN